MTIEAIKQSGRDGKKIKGFFGMFDILGYRSLIKNDIDKVIDIVYDYICDRHLPALAFADSHNAILQPPAQPMSLAFSDTFIFYQEYYPNETQFQKFQRVSAFIISTCYLLRLAFEEGIPLRGAISFGEYYIDTKNMIFLGCPAVEAHDVGISQDWSGAVLCKSAHDFVKPMLENKDLQNNILKIKANEECKGCGRTCPFDLNEYLTEYKIPCKESTPEGIALRWDDFAVRDLLGFEFGKININCETGDIEEYHEIYRKVEEIFGAHNKDITNEKIKNKIERKIENTSKFMEYINNTYSEEFKIIKYQRACMPHKIK